jgi:polyhydroxybutyrate depolymerase
MQTDNAYMNPFIIPGRIALLLYAVLGLVACSSGGSSTSAPPKTDLVSISNASAEEGSQISFTVSLPEPAKSDTTVTLAVADGSATSADYSVPTNSLVITAGEQSALFIVDTMSDNVVGFDKTFSVTITSASDANGELDFDTTPATGTILGEVVLETGDTLSGYPHAIDIYAARNATKVIVFLHGGGGTKMAFACNLGILLTTSDCTNPVTPTAPTDFDTTWLIDNKAVAVFPQGQSLGTTTWNNHVMDSGVDDMAFLGALVDYINTNYGTVDVYLAGHSNGGMMANRVWCENPGLFKAYISISGPPSEYYYDSSNNMDPGKCIPYNGSAQVKDYYAIIGQQDAVLGDNPGWADPTWTINFTLSQAPGFVNPVLIGGWVDHVAKSGIMCGDVPVLTADTGDGTGYTTDGIVLTWSSCGGSIKLQRVTNAGHAIDSLETQAGSRILDLIASYIASIS